MSQDKVKEPLLKILKQNPGKWISSNKLVRITGFEKHSLLYNLRKFDERGIIERKKEPNKKNGTKMTYVRYRD